MKRIINSFLPALFSAFVLLAAVGVKPACWYFWYQAEVPSALKK